MPLSLVIDFPSPVLPLTAAKWVAPKWVRKDAQTIVNSSTRLTLKLHSPGLYTFMEATP